MKRALSGVWLVGCLAMVPSAAFPQDQAWPEKPVTVILPSAAGAASDVLTRAILQHLSKRVGQPFVVENRPGAAGAIGLAALKRAAPDGYTIGYGNINNLAVNPSLFKKLTYDPADFVPVGPMFTVPNLLVVRADAPFKTAQDLIAAAKASPGKLIWAASNLGSSGHIGGELFNSMAKIETRFIPYNGDPATLADLVGGQLDFTVTNAPVAWPMIQAGKLRALAITTRQRAPQAPGIPTLDESGLPGYESGAWGGLIAPQGTPEAVLQKMSAVLEKTLQSEEVRTALEKAFATPTPGSRQEFARYIASEQRKWADVIDASRIEKQ